MNRQDPVSPHRSRRGFWSVAATFVVVMAYSALPTPLYVLYERRDGLTSLAITVVFALYAAGVATSLLLAGHASDWLGRRRVMLAATLLTALSVPLFLFGSGLLALGAARLLNGLGVGALTATGTAWLAELHAAAWPRTNVRRAHAVAAAANLGGIGVGPLVGGVLAQWVDHPLSVPYLVMLAALGLAAAATATAPETRSASSPRPPYRIGHVAVPAGAASTFLGAAISVSLVFAWFGLFTSLSPSFLAGTLHHRSPALAGASSFAVFAAAAGAQAALRGVGPGTQTRWGAEAMLAGLLATVLAVWLPAPSLVLFLGGGALAGGGAGLLFRGALTTVTELAPADRRAETLAGFYLAGYVGISIPVIGLGLLTQVLSARTGLLVFAAVQGAGLIAALRGAQRPRSAAALPASI